MTKITPEDALIAVDIQNDFLPGGTLGVHAGHRIVPIINSLLPRFRTLVFTRDWHPPDHSSFSEDPAYRDGSWPPHCVRDTPGAAFHDDLEVPQDAFIVSKAAERDCEEYSSFRASNHDLANWLREQGVTRVFVAGLATDYCVRATALDARAARFQVVVIEDAVAGVSDDTVEKAWADMLAAGVERVHSDDLQ